jgi:hypothetical protein
MENNPNWEGKTKDNGKVAVYDYKIQRANPISFFSLAHQATLEVYQDAFGVQNFLSEQLNAYEQSKTAVVVAGNSGLPGGAVGLHVNVMQDVTTRERLSTSPISGKSTYGTQEEDVVKNWLLSEYDKNGTPILNSMNLIFSDYGMEDYGDVSPNTKQGVNFTNLTKSHPDILAHLKQREFPFERLYAEAVVVRDALLRPKTHRKPDAYADDAFITTHLVFVAGPNVGAKGSGDKRSTTLRTFNTFLSTHEDKFLEGVKWTYYAALHAIAMEGKRIALLPWISGQLYAGPFRRTYGVQSDGTLMRHIINSVLGMRCIINDEYKTLGQAFERVILVHI